MNYRLVNPVVVFNLRFRWPQELEKYSDKAISHLYEDFTNSDDSGRNDEKFPEWFELLDAYENPA